MRGSAEHEISFLTLCLAIEMFACKYVENLKLNDILTLQIDVKHAKNNNLIILASGVLDCNHGIIMLLCTGIKTTPLYNMLFSYILS